jgi:hypothetical protein
MDLSFHFLKTAPIYLFPFPFYDQDFNFKKVQQFSVLAHRCCLQMLPGVILHPPLINTQAVFSNAP